MKLHLPVSLRKCLFALMSAVVAVTSESAYSAVMNSDLSIMTYADFGQNMGRYKTDATSNALLQFIRSEAGGVTLVYTGGQEDYILPHEMPDFTGTTNDGAFMSLGVNATVSVQHNSVTSGGFTNAYIGNQQIFYQGIEYRIDNSETFLHSPGGGYDNRNHGGFDHKVTRMSKVITDVNTATLFSGSSAEMRQYVVGELVYHAGAGSMGIYNSQTGTQSGLTGAYIYIIGGIDTADSASAVGKGDVVKTDFTKQGSNFSTVNEPMPFAGQQGDSGSPIFVYNTNTGQYEYIGAVAYIGGNTTETWGAISYVHDALASYDKIVQSSSDINELHLGAVIIAGETITANSVAFNYHMNRSESTTPYSGLVVDANGNVLQSFVGVKSGIHTWKSLGAVINNDNWYTYNNTYLNAAPHIEGSHATSGKELTYADLFVTENLVFRANTEQTYVVLDATVDLGIGYAQFSKENEIDHARFDISSADSGQHQFNHAGYVIDDGVEVHSTLTGSADYVYEWRKIGAGDFYIEGRGDNTVLLNLGGSGKTILNREGGYAAYNVLANTGATVVIRDINQIARDFTFGHQGGVLDMNGNSMVWNNAVKDVSASGFTIHALDESAIVANMKSGTTTTLTWTQSGNHAFLGSFKDNGVDSKLRFVYDGGEGSSLLLNSIYTSLTAEGSGVEVQSGSVTLSGTITVHGKGSATGTNANRVVRSNDWHYADAAMDVNVKAGASFELSSHARLSGAVIVEEGGHFVMREGVKERYEYVEGGSLLEDTYIYRSFYGLKGDAHVDGSMLVEYSEGTTARNIYDGNISGDGSLTINLGTDGAVLELGGDNAAYTGVKTLVSGGLVATNATSLGDTSTQKWLVGSLAWIASQKESGATLLNRLDTTSTGTLALSSDTLVQLDFSDHCGMYLGAEEGKSVQYGTTDVALEAVLGKWQLGGGGGDLVVNFLLTGHNDLVLGAHEGATGIVTLANSGNDFFGDIIFNSRGIILKTAVGGLGNSFINLSYGNAFAASYSEAVNNIVNDSDGILIVDDFSDCDIDLSDHQSLSIGASDQVNYTGNVILADGQDYRFSATDKGELHIVSALDKTRNIVADAQGFVGGKVILSGNDLWLGDITVHGHKEQAGSGQLFLTLGRDMTLSGNILLRQGGILDIAGHQLTVTHSLSSDGGYVYDSAATGTLVFDTTAGELTSNAVMNLNSVRKVGSNKLTLSGNNSFANLYVEDGTLAISGNAATQRQSRIHLTDGSILELNVPQINFSISMDDNAGSAWIQSNNTGETVFNNNISLGSGSSLLFGAGKTYVFAGSQYGGKGASLTVNGGTMKLQNTNTQSFSGSLLLNDDVRVESHGKSEDMGRSFDEICVGGGTVTLWEESWNTIWNIGKLSGEGALVWDSNTTHDYTSRLVLGGEGDFRGTITLDRKFKREDRTHGAFIELVHNNAAKNADIELKGASATAVASLAVNTDNAHIKGLSGNANSYVYAGQSMDAASLRGNNRPNTTRLATLTIDTDADKSYTYSGTIGSASDSLNAGLSLVKDGMGMQTLNGSVTLCHLSVLAGQLSVSQASILGNVELARGATLNLAEFNLTTDKSFAVLGSTHSSGATFSGNLLLNGGTLEFDGDALLADGGVSLNVGSIIKGENVTTQNIAFRGFQALRAGVTYTLASGDWNGLIDSVIVSGLEDFYSAELSISNEGYLQMTLASLSGSAVWDGNDASHEWSAVTFGQQSVIPTEQALFDDVATNKDVIVTSEVGVKNALFQTSGVYSITAQDGGLATVESLLLNGGGSLVLNSGILVTGNAEIQSGELIVKSTGLVSGKVSGNGTLVIDWGEATGAIDIVSLNTLHIASGQFSATGAPQVQNLILDDGSRYIQSGKVNQSIHITSYGGTLELAGGSLGGTLTLHDDTELNLRSGTLYLNTNFADNGATFTQTGNGTVTLNGAFSGHVTHYVVNSGTLRLEGTRNFTNMDTITVQNGAALLLTYGTGVNIHSVVLESGARLRLLNGTSAQGAYHHFTANIRTQDGAKICGSLYGNETNINGTITGTGTLIFDQDENGSNQYTVNSLIQDSSDGALALKMQSPDIVLTSANIYSGGTHIAGGVVRTANPTALGTGAVNLTGSGQLHLNTKLTVSSLIGTGGTVYTNGNVLTIDQQSGAAEFSGTIASGSLVRKTGEGASTFSGAVNLQTLEVLNGSLSLTGASVVNAASIQGGTLTVNGMRGTGSLHHLQVSGGAVQVAGNTVIDAATVQNGVLTVTGSGNTFADLRVESDGEVQLNGHVALQSTIQNAGIITIGSGASFTLSYDAFVDGSFVLISGTGSITYLDTISADNIFIGGAALSGMPIYDIVQGENSFSVSMSMPQEVYTWTGAQNGIWDLANTNWVSADSGNASSFKAYCNALFTQDAAQKVVTVGSSGVVLNNLTVESGDYTFNGSAYNILGTFVVKNQASATLNAIPNSVENVIVEGALNLGFDGTWTQSVDASSGVINKLSSSELIWNPASGKIVAHELNIQAGSFKSSAALQVDKIGIASSSTVTLNQTLGTVATIGSITGNGTLIKDAAGSLQLGDASLAKLELKGGNTTINGTVVIDGQLSIGKESVVLDAGANVTAKQFTSGNTANWQPSMVAINEGASLTITDKNGVDDKTSTFLLAHWKNADSTLLLNGGTLKAEKTRVLMGWDSAGTFKAMAGEARLKGVLFSSQRQNHADRFILGSATEGSASVYIGSDGISGIKNNDFVTLGEGSIIATADFSVSGNKSVDLVGTKGGTVINTNGHTVTLASGIAGSGKLVKSGAGTLKINSSSLNNASIAVQQGVLDMSGLTLSDTALSSLSLARGSSLTMGNKDLNLVQNLTLLIQGDNYTQSANLDGNLNLNGGILSFSADSLVNDRVALSVSGGISSANGLTQVITLQDSAVLGSGTYMLMSGNFEGLTSESFILNGVQSGSLVLEDNILWLNYDDSHGSVVWNGAYDTFVWSSDVFGGYESSVLDGSKTVVFDDSASVRQVTLGSSVEVEGGLLFNNTKEYSFSSSNINYAIHADSLTLNESGKTNINVELNINGEVSLSKGTLVLNAFADLDEATSVHLKDGATLDITGTTQTLANLEMEEGTTITDINGAGTVVLSGTCSVAGLLNVGTINTTADASIITGNKLSTLQVLGGITEISGYTAATLKNIVLGDGAALHLVDGYTLGSGSTITLTGSAELDGALVVSGGQLLLGGALTADGSPLLSLSGSLTRAENGVLNIVVQDVMQYAAGGTFALIQGDFSGFDINHFTLSGEYSEYINLKLNADKNMLSMHLGSIGIWNGTESSHLWNSESFGSAQSLTSDGHAIFNDNASYTDVVIADNVTLQSIEVDTGKHYHFELDSGVSLVTDSFSLQSGSVTIGGEEAALTISGKLYAKTGELNIGSSEGDSVLLTTGSLEASDSNNAGDLTINLAEGATLKITGNDVVGDYKTTAFLLSEWNAVTTLNVAGSILAQNASLLVGDSSANIYVSGTMAVKGIGNAASNKNGGTITMSLADGAKLILGASGITTGKQFVANLGAATIGISADSTIAEDLVINNTDGTVFDTTKYVFAEDGNSITRGAEGGMLTLAGALSGSGKLIKDGNGTLKLTGHSANFNGEISVNEGILSIGSDSSDLLTFAANIVVNKDSSLDLTDIAIAEGSSSLLNSVSGTGAVLLDYAVAGNGTAFDFSSFTGTVRVAGGRVLLSSSEKGNVAPNIELTSSNSQLVFDGKSTVWNGNVSLLADTDIYTNGEKYGEISGSLTGQKLTKKGAGILVASGGVNLTTLVTSVGEMVITGHNNEVGVLDGSLGKKATGKLRLAEQAQLTVTGKIWSRSHASTDIVLEKGASLTSTQDSVIFSNRQGNQPTSLKTSIADEEYSIGSSTYVLSNGHLQYTKNEDAELKNKLTNSSVAFSPENANVADALHTLTVNNEDNILTGIFAEGGNINVQNQASHSLQELKVAAGLTVGAYTGSSISASDEALIKVSQMAQFGHGATLNADLVMESGATLQMDGTVTMGSDLTLMAGLTLTGSQYEAVRNLIADGESKVVLFEGIDKLILGDTEYTASITMDDNILAHTYFGNIGSDYLLVYDATVPGNGVLSIMAAVPEPSTATLSLLALAALAARRRRR